MLPLDRGESSSGEDVSSSFSHEENTKVEKEFSGEPQISAAPGDDVILPCRLDSEEDLQDHMVEWTKLEIEPDPAGRRFVYLYLNRKIMNEFMMETFIQRVSLNPDGLKRGDVTLKIRKVTFQDEGTYRCIIPGLNHRETVHLVVDPHRVTAPTMETSPDPGGEQTNTMSSYSRPALWIGLGVFLSSIFSAVLVCIFQKRRQKKLLNCLRPGPL
ncbi:hypothetical protein OJAV_G00184600 [Oryzias javanicus]|uniref:Ig-like domain-containing protein n=1 Tax=Oryzias javanicus TaxID=123683 RepID=A0A437CDG4_ORYJA|nr:hypothetical protein OJAV_G00184600 [Oryzias javanicus]